MRQPCKNPNGLSNSYAIERNKKYKIFVKFNSEEKAKRYLKSEGYRYRDSYNYKEDRSTLWQSRLNWLQMSSTYDYLNDNTMEMGTVWTLKSLEYYEVIQMNLLKAIKILLMDILNIKIMLTTKQWNTLKIKYPLIYKKIMN